MVPDFKKPAPDWSNQTNDPITEESTYTKLRRRYKSSRKHKQGTLHSEIKKTPVESRFGREPRTKLSNLKNAIQVDSKDLSVYITRNSAEKRQCQRKDNRAKIQTGKDFSQTKKATSSVGIDNFNFLLKLKKNQKGLAG